MHQYGFPHFVLYVEIGSGVNKRSDDIGAFVTYSCIHQRRVADQSGIFSGDLVEAKLQLEINAIGSSNKQNISKIFLKVFLPFFGPPLTFVYPLSSQELRFVSLTIEGAMNNSTAFSGIGGSWT